MHIQGFLRALHGDIINMVMSLLGIGVVYAVTYTLTLRSKGSDDILKAITRLALSFAALIVGCFILHALVVASVNRMPRQDVDKDDVYRQMQH